MSSFKLDRVFFRRFGTLLKIMFPFCICAPVFLSIYLLVVSVLEEVLTYYIGILPSQFYVALGNRNRSMFNTLAWKSICLVIAKCLILTTIKYASAVLYITWRSLLCQHVHALYFRGYAYYEVNVLRKDQIDNVDQRVAQDVDKTCKLFSEIFAKVLIAPFIIGYYTYLTYRSSGYLGPLAIYVYFVTGTIINKFLMTPIIGLVFQQERKEGDFRFKHVAVRSNAEAIGFYNSGLLENYLANGALDSLLNTQQRLINWQFALNLSTNIFDYFGSILSYLILAIAIFLLDLYEDVPPIELARIVSQNSFFYMYLINAFSRLIDLSSKVSNMAGTTHRVAELIEFLRKYQKEKSDADDLSKPEANCIANRRPRAPDPDLYFALDFVSYKAPSHQSLLTNELSFNIVRGMKLLITGESSSGKTSILRVLCGLWRTETGIVSTNIERTPQHVIFLPQKPYFPYGSLRQQVVYPYRAGFVPAGPQFDMAIAEALFAVRLDNLIERCGGLDGQPDGDWNDVLSPGEMQRLSMARVYFHKPQIAFLDEGTSAVGTEMETKMYEKLSELGINYVSVGHRRTLRFYHSQRLHLDGRGGWTLVEIEDENGGNANGTSTYGGSSSFGGSKETVNARL